MPFFTKKNWAPAADADDLFKHTWVHMCPYVFAPCYFWTLDKKEWEDHLIALHGQRLDSAAQEEPNLVFQGNDTLTTFI